MLGPIFLSLLIIVALGVPIAFSLGLSSVLFFFREALDLAVLNQKMATAVDSFVLLAVPFYILAGLIMNTGGMTMRIFRFANSMVGHIPGGLAHVNVVNSMIFAGMSGSIIADAAGIGAIEIEAMTKEGFDRSFSAAVTAASATIGPIIPPSIIMVVYGVTADVSIGRLFIGGIIPGVLIGLALMAYIYLLAKRRDFPRHPRAPWREFWVSLVAAIPALIAPAILIGGLMLGIFTATEAGAVAVVYAILVGAFVYREMGFRELVTVLVDGMLLTATLCFIMATAAAFAWVMAYYRVPDLVATWLTGFTSNRLLLFLLIMALYLILGCFLEPTAIILTTIPIVTPVIKKMGIDPVHFGVVLTLNMCIGTITPPVGTVLYAVTAIARVTVEEFMAAFFPMLLVLVGVMLLLIVLPDLVLLLPNLVMPPGK